MVVFGLTVTLVTITLSCGVLFWTIFQQKATSSFRISNQCVLPSPPLFFEFRAPDVAYCNGRWPVTTSIPLPKNFTDLLRDCENSFADLNPPLEKKCNRPWMPAPFQRAIWLIIDGLRFDWLAYNPEYGDWVDTRNLRYGNDKPPPKQAYNTLAFTHNMLNHSVLRHHSRLYRVVADTPTMTVQRVGGLMQGNVPPLIDMSKILLDTLISTEDSLPLQMKSAGKRLVTLGDDTWYRLYGSLLSASLADPGNNIYDVDAVDEGIHQRLWKLLYMAKNPSNTDHHYDHTVHSSIARNLTQIRGDWDWLIAHTLGSDAVGHSKGTESPLLREKYEIYDKFIANIVNFMSGGRIGRPFFSKSLESHKLQAPLPDHLATFRSIEPLLGTFEHVYSDESAKEDRFWDDAILMVMGDHGVADSGNHGGSSAAEIETGLFAYVPRTLLNRDFFNLPSSVDTTFLTHYPSFEEVHAYGFDSVDQVDITTSMAFLLGIPVPAGSLGSIIPHLFPLYEPARNRTKRNGWKQLIQIVDCSDSKGVIWPMSKDANLECRLIGAEQSVGIGRVSTHEIPSGYVISRLAAWRHLRYLVNMYHIVAWSLNLRLKELEDRRTDVFLLLNRDKELQSLWNRLQSRTGSIVKNDPYWPLFAEIRSTKNGRQEEIELSINSMIVDERLEELDKWLYDLALYHKAAKQILKRAEENSIRTSEALCFGVLPIVMTLLSLAIQLYRQTSLPGVKVYLASLLVFGLSYRYLHNRCTPLQLCWVTGSYIWITEVCKLSFSCFAHSRGQKGSAQTEEVPVLEAILHRLLPKDISTLFTVWDLTPLLLLCAYAGLQTAHGAAFEHPGIVTRFFLQVMYLCIVCRILMRIWHLYPRQLSDESRKHIWKRTSILCLHTTWFLLLCRLSDSFDPRYKPPGTHYDDVKRQKKTENTDVTAALVAVVTALLLYSLFPSESPVDIFYRISNDFTKSLNWYNPADILHLLLHLFGVKNIGNEARLVTDPSSPMKSIASPVTGSDATKVSPFVCCSSAQKLASLDRPISPPRSERSATRTFALHKITAIIWVCNAVLASIYFSACHRVSQETQGRVMPSQYTQRLLVNVGTHLGFNASEVRTFSSNQALKLFLPRIAVYFSWFHILSILFHTSLRRNPARYELALIIAGTTYLGHLFLQDVSQAIAILLQTLLVPPLAHVFTLAVTEVLIPPNCLEIRAMDSEDRCEERILHCRSETSSTLSPSHLVKLRQRQVDTFHCSTPQKSRHVAAFRNRVDDFNSCNALPGSSRRPEAPVKRVSDRTPYSGGHSKSILPYVEYCNLSQNGSLPQQLFDSLDHFGSRRMLRQFGEELRGTAHTNPGSTAPLAIRILKGWRLKCHLPMSDTEMVSLLTLLSYHWTYTNGHRSEVSALPLSAGFTGMTRFSMTISASLIIYHCVAPLIILPFVIYHFTLLRITRGGASTLRKKIQMNVSRFFFWRALISVGMNVLSVYSLRNDIVAWRHYAPKFCSDVAAFLIASPFLFFTLYISKFSL